MVLNMFQINTKERITNFIAQCMRESECGQYLHKIASGNEYQDRADLGNTNPGDGMKYKGAGNIQRIRVKRNNQVEADRTQLRVLGCY
jgi:predicted chitinase